MGAILNQAMKIFYFLNFFDIHPKFEDNLNVWMQLLVKSLRANIQDFLGFKVKGAALRYLFLYLLGAMCDIAGVFIFYKQLSEF